MAQDYASLVQHIANPARQHRSSPPTSLMSLPREIRDEIYILALVSPSPIIVWKGEWRWSPQDTNDRPYTGYADYRGGRWFIRRREIDQLTSKTSLYSLSTSLLICSKIISQEAASVFYNKNTFSFLGDHNWDPVVSWLETIGTQNRGSLSNLVIYAYPPDQVWQCANGERIEHPIKHETQEVVYPRNPHLCAHIGGFKRGLVDNINPSLETMFQLLGNRAPSVQKVTLTFKLQYGEYPGQGALCDDEYEDPDLRWYGMDLPNLVEKFRILYTCGTGGLKSSVEVLWKGESNLSLWYNQDGICGRVVIPGHLQNIEDHGWQIEILPEKDDTIWEQTHGTCYIVPTYVLKRNRLNEPLMGYDPNPYSDSVIWSLSEQDQRDFEEIAG